MTQATDVVVVGGGIAGLEGTRELIQSGLHVILLEARDRLGGRIWTKHVNDYPVELGAEFVHGRPPDMLSQISQAGLELAPVEGKLVSKLQDHWEPSGAIIDEVNKLFEEMPAEQPDQTFSHYVGQSKWSDQAKEHALNFVQGFHAADPERVSVHWLIQAAKAEEEIDGDHSSRLVHGYEGLIHSLESEIDGRAEIRLSSPVREVRWTPATVTVKTDSGAYLASRAVITVPLSLLQSRAIRFDPAISDKDNALRQLAMGPVMRVSLCFRERFWERSARLSGFSFMFTDDPDFPTWWSLHPLSFPVLTGWAGGSRAARLASASKEQIVETALNSLSRILESDPSHLRPQLQAACTHNWETDRYSQGAYSYALAGGAGAFRELAKPVAETLFFAGEATEFTGHNGTVHGAMATGARAANEVIESLGRKPAATK